MKNLSFLVGDTLRPLAKKFGLVNASILLDWDKIVGQEFSKICWPYKITFPYKKNSEGQLILLTYSGGLALQLNYMKDPILDRINTYYGYKAVSRLIIQQSMLPNVKGKAQPNINHDTISVSHDEGVLNLLSSIQEESLQQALSRLGLAIKRKTISAQPPTKKQPL